jgi:hypothetical protein
VSRAASQLLIEFKPHFGRFCHTPSRGRPAMVQGPGEQASWLIYIPLVRLSLPSWEVRFSLHHLWCCLAINRCMPRSRRPMVGAAAEREVAEGEVAVVAAVSMVGAAVAEQVAAESMVAALAATAAVAIMAAGPVAVPTVMAAWVVMAPLVGARLRVDTLRQAQRMVSTVAMAPWGEERL